MNTVFGISYGNSTACVAVYKEDGRVDIIANDAGDRATATSVFISNNEKVVGLATGGNVSRINSTVTRNKSFLESPLSDESFESIKTSLVVKIERDETSGKISFKIPDGDSTINVSPIDVAVLIFKKLYSIGQSAVGESRLHCVLSVPQYWNNDTRQSVKQAAEKAGWTVLQLISEPSAALLAYLPAHNTVNLTALVYRVGGYSCEATVIKVTSGFYQTLGYERRDVGVRNVIDTVSKHLADEFKRKTKLEPTESRKCMCKLWSASETMVRTLSSLPTASLYLESLCEGVDFTAGLSRARLDSLLSTIVPLLVEPIHNILESLSLRAQQIDKVVTTGGGLNIPRLRSEVASIFSSGGATELCDYLQPQEVNAMGAAGQAGLLASAFQSSSDIPEELKSSKLFLNLLSSPLCLKLSTGEEIILEGALPLSKSLTVNLEENNSCLEIHATQDSLSANMKFDGFDSTPTPLRVHLDLTEKSFEVQVVDMSTNVSQTSPLLFNPT